MYHKKSLSWIRHLDFTILDILSLIVSIVISYYIIRPRGSSSILTNSQYQGLILSFVLADLFVISIFNSMEHVLKRGVGKELYVTLRNAAMVAAIETMYNFTVKMGSYYSRLTFFLAVGMYFVVSFGVRMAYKPIYRKYVAPKVSSSMLIITDMANLPALKEQLEKKSFDSYILPGIVVTDLPEELPELPLPMAARMENLVDWVRKNWVDEVLLALPLDQTAAEYANIFMSMGITVHVGVSLMKGIMPNRKQEIEKLGSYDVITMYWKSTSVPEAALKRLLDLVGAVFGCVITLLLTLVIGPAIYIASPGPIFYKQNRIGKNGKVFKMYKFRSMYLDADARKKEFMAQNRVAGGLMFKLDWDPRIIGNRTLPDGSRKSGIGEFIRKTSLDEFPQFFNVLKGDMSLVGTRPPTLDEWVRYEDHHRARMAMRPGITGMWQVSGRSNITDFEEIVRLDTKYIDEWTPLLDLQILIKTVLVVLKHEGSL